MQSMVANRIKTIRMEKGISQTELAAKCNVCKSLISKIESNNTTLHLNLVAAIANALEISFIELLEPNPSLMRKGNVVRAEERRNLIAGTPGKVGHHYSRLAGSERIDTFWLCITEEAQKGQKFVVHPGYEFCYVIKGKIKLEFSDEEYLLKEGDTASFNGGQEHRITPINCDLAEMIVIFVRD